MVAICSRAASGSMVVSMVSARRRMGDGADGQVLREDGAGVGAGVDEAKVSGGGRVLAAGSSGPEGRGLNELGVAVVVERG